MHGGGECIRLITILSTNIVVPPAPKVLRSQRHGIACNKFSSMMIVSIVILSECIQISARQKLDGFCVKLIVHDKKRS